MMMGEKQVFDVVTITLCAKQVHQRPWTKI